jgi:hypothetical protein
VGLGEPGLTGPTEPIPIDPNDPDAHCELIDGPPLHPHQVMALVANTTVHRTLALTVEPVIA